MNIPGADEKENVDIDIPTYDNDVEITEETPTVDTIIADSWSKRVFLFFLGCVIRIIENCLSIKIWALTTIFFYSSYLLIQGHIESGDWCTLNGVCISVVLGMREIYKLGSVYSVKDIKKNFPKIPKINL